MIIARMLSPVTTLGPGRRVGLWTMGCRKACQGCIAPELAPFEKERDLPVEFVAARLREMALRNQCRGLTLSGGDPMEQGPELWKLLKAVRGDFEDILVYTGFTLEEIQEGKAGEEAKASLGLIDVLIDGRYIESLNQGEALKGSSNQRIHYLTPGKEALYEEVRGQGRRVETFLHGEKALSIGIP